MSKYSPGPWRWDHHDFDGEAGDVLIDANSAIVADGMAETGTGTIRGWVNVSDADARLIAAAPELLEMLRDWSQNWCCRSRQHRCERCQAADALIRRIEGEARPAGSLAEFDAALAADAEARYRRGR